MKKKNDMKKLALLGMAAGMLMSNSQLHANNADASSYLAAKCGGSGKCGGTVAAGCGGSGKCSGTVADRSPSASYYSQSCNSYQQPSGHGCGGYQGHTCQSYQPMNHSCNSQYQNNAQGYYDPSQYSNNNNNNNNNNKYAGSNTQQQNQQQNQQQGQPQQNPTSKYQASNGCGGKHGCNSGTTEGPHDGGKFQASNGCGGNRQNNNNNSGSYYYNPNQVAAADAQVTTPKMNEADMLGKLNAQGKSTYNSLSPEGKKLALQLSNAECKGKNDCKGLNSCKTDKNECAGKGGCKGQSNCSFKDKNLAVKVAAAKMAEKRNGLQSKNAK